MNEIELKNGMYLIMRDKMMYKITSIENGLITSNLVIKPSCIHTIEDPFKLQNDADYDVMQILDGDKIVWQRQELQPSDIRIGDKLMEIDRGMPMTVVGIWSHLDATTANTTIIMDFEENMGDVLEFGLRELKRAE